LLLPVLGGAVCSGIVLRYDLLRGLKRPIDGGLCLGGRRLFGDHKTWRGLVCGVVGCVGVVAAQKHLVGDRVGSNAVLDYARIDPVVFGTALGAAAMAGELPNSFVKRRLAIAPGAVAPCGAGPLFYVLDQVDFLFAVWPVVRCWVRPTTSVVLSSFGLVFVAHQAVSGLGYLIGARRSVLS
jgi:CDP-2,3-bis-(O-geranylgeranyl)-sn-glycerol synthase